MAIAPWWPLINDGSMVAVAGGCCMESPAGKAAREQPVPVHPHSMSGGGGAVAAPAAAGACLCTGARVVRLHALVSAACYRYRMVIVEVPPPTPARRACCSVADRVPLPACAPHRPAADPGHSGRAHQPRGVALVQRPCGQWQVGAVVYKGGGACGWGAAARASQMSMTPRTLLLKCACVPTWCCWRSRPTAPSPSVPAAQLPQFVLCLPAHPHRGSAASGCSSLASQQASAPCTSAAPARTHARTHAAAGAQWWTRGGRQRLAAT